MKKSIAFMAAAVMALTAAFAFSGCGSNGSDKPRSGAADAAATQAAATQAAATQAAETAAITADDVVFTKDSVKVELNGDAEAAVAALGEPVSSGSQLSCHGEGEDKTYTYDGFVLNTYPLEGKDRVLEIVINAPGITTSKGIQVGDSVSAVTAAYGENFKEVGLYHAYSAGEGKSLQFFIQNDAVQEISYYYDV